MYNLIRTTSAAKSASKNSFLTLTLSKLKLMNKNILGVCLLLTLSLFVFRDANAQTTYTWNFTTAAATTGSNANLTVDTFKQGNNLGTTVPRVSSVPSSGYSGASGTFNLGAAARVGVLNQAASGSAYFELTLTPASGYIVTVTGLSFGRRATSTGPKNFVVKSSKDSYVDSLAGDTITANSTWQLESPTFTSVASAAGTALTLRIYGYNGTGTASSGTANWRIDDVSLTVNVTSAEVAPAAPTSGGNQSICIGATVPDLSASAPGGAVVDWYANASGGTALTTNSNTYSTGATTEGTYTYYAESRNSPGSLKSATRTAVTLTINPIVTPTIDIDAADLEPAPGDPLSLYINDQTNQGGSPTYQWYKNGSLIPSATNSTYSTTSFADGDQFYLIMTSSASCTTISTAQSNTLVAIVNSNACSGTPPTTSATASSTNVCSGGSSNLSLTGLGAATGYTFQWQTSITQNGTYNNISGANSSSYAASNIVTAFWYRCVVTCTASGLSANSNSVQIAVTANLTPNVTIATSTNPSCDGASVTYIATPINGGTTPTYEWYLNGSLVSGQTTANYVTSALANNDQLYAVLVSNYVCLTKTRDTSATTTHNVTANVAATVAIVSSANPACAGASVTFTASPNNGGTTPTYQWYNGASPISGETAATYTSSSLTNGASITVRMTSALTCVTGSPATSNAISQTITANVTPSLTIASNNNPVCVSGSATFNISPVNGGSTPVYAWYLNGGLVSGETGTTYTLSSVNNNDSVYATMTSSTTCVTTASATSNVVKESVVSPTSPTVAITANPGTSIFEGVNITFTASTTFGGTTPSYQWKVNGSNVGTSSSTYSSSLLAQGDSVQCILTSNYTCLSGGATASSNKLGINILAANPFTPGNILVYKVGDSAATLSGNGSIVYLNEYTTSGTFVQSKRLTRTTAGVTTIYSAGTTTSEGFMSLNLNGTNVAVGGYNSTSSNATALGSTAPATVKRIVALVDINQNIDTTTKLKDVTGNMRSVVANGNAIYTSSSSAGVRYCQKGDSTSTQLSSTVTNLRNIGVFNGQLYTTTSSGSAVRLGAVGTGTPTAGGNTIVNLSGLPTSTGSPYGFFFADLSSSVAGVDVVYVADDAASTITKYSLVSGTWTSNGTVTAGGVRGLTGSVSGTSVSLYGTGTISTPAIGTFVYTYTDNGGYNASISGTATNLVDRSSVSLIAFRGISFTPTQITTQPANTTICTGSTGTISITMATGSSSSIYSYQWQASSDGGNNWANISNGAVYNNTTTSSLTIADPTGLNNVQYRCLVVYMGTTTLTSNAATLTVATNVTPEVTISTASTTVCSGNSVSFDAASTTGGSSPLFTWYKNGTVSLGSGSSIIIPAGTLTNGNTISCILTANNVCQTSNTDTSNIVQLTVNASPAIGISSGGTTICTIGSTKSVNNSNTLGGGVWSSDNVGVATVSTVSGASGIVTAVANGTAILTYTKTASNGCMSSASTTMIVDAATAPNAITGTNSICKGATTVLNSTTSGGVWTSQNGYATISGTTVTGVNAGTAVIRYTVTNGSGCSAYASYNVTVNATPAVPTIGYASGTTNPQTGSGGGFCVGRTFTVVGSPTGVSRTWTSSNTLAATVTSGGVFNTVGVGSTTLTYTYTNANGCSNSRSITGNVVTCASRGVANNSQAATTNELITSDFVLFPNPARSVVNLQVETLIGTGSIVITNLYGKQIKTQPLSMGTNSIDVSAFAKGMYFVSIITNEGKTTKKIIVE